MKRSNIAIAALVTLSAAMPATAQTAYTNKAAFLTAAGSTQTETFGSSSVGNFASSGGVFNATFDGFSVTGQNNGNFVGIATGSVANTGPNYPVPGAFAGQNYLEWGNITGGIMSMTINFNAATTAFGFDWFDTDVTDSYSINIPGGTIFNSPPFNLANASGATSGFFGLVNSTAFTSIVITNNQTGGYMSDEGMDNFITNGEGSVNSAPEPASLILIGTGLAGIAVAARRRKRA